MQNDAPKACHVVQEWVEGYETTCPVLLFNEVGVVFKAYNMVDKGQLPHSGGGFDQPHKLMHFVDLVKSVMIKDN